MDEEDIKEILEDSLADFTEEEKSHYRAIRLIELNCLDDDLKTIHDGFTEEKLSIQIIRLLRQILNKLD